MCWPIVRSIGDSNLQQFQSELGSCVLLRIGTCSGRLGGSKPRGIKKELLLRLHNKYTSNTFSKFRVLGLVSCEKKF